MQYQELKFTTQNILIQLDCRHTLHPAGGHSRGQKMADAEITADEDCPECYVQGVCLSLLASTIQSMGYCCWKVREQCRAPALHAAATDGKNADIFLLRIARPPVAAASQALHCSAQKCPCALPFPRARHARLLP